MSEKDKTVDSTKHKMTVMQAFLDGEKIECVYTEGRWCRTENPTWNWDNNDYRVVKAMSCSEDEGWIKWSGEEQSPVSTYTKVHVKHRNGVEEKWASFKLQWKHANSDYDIIAYKVD